MSTTPSTPTTNDDDYLAWLAEESAQGKPQISADGETQPDVDYSRFPTTPLQQWHEAVLDTQTGDANFESHMRELHFLRRYESARHSRPSGEWTDNDLLEDVQARSDCWMGADLIEAERFLDGLAELRRLTVDEFEPQPACAGGSRFCFNDVAVAGIRTAFFGQSSAECPPLDATTATRVALYTIALRLVQLRTENESRLNSCHEDFIEIELLQAALR